jgi:hypothetical protein
MRLSAGWRATPGFTIRCFRLFIWPISGRAGPAGARGRQRLALPGHGPPASRKPGTRQRFGRLRGKPGAGRLAGPRFALRRANGRRRPGGSSAAGTQRLIDSLPSGCWPMNPSQLLYVLVGMHSHETRVRAQPLARKDRRNPERPFRWLDRTSGPGPRRRVALAVVIGGLVLATFGLINVSSLLLLAGVGVLAAVVRAMAGQPRCGSCSCHISADVYQRTATTTAVCRLLPAAPIRSRPVH